MSSFESRVENVSTQFDETCRQMKDEKKNSDWNLKVDVESRIDKFMGEVQLTNEKEREHTKMTKRTFSPLDFFSPIFVQWSIFQWVKAFC